MVRLNYRTGTNLIKIHHFWTENSIDFVAQLDVR